MIDENNRFIFVIDNGEYVFYDFKGKKANILDMNQTEDMLNILANENEQLKQRNNRQAKQLDKLYTLIEKEDWQALKGIIQDFQECEEQLQRESKYYEKGLSND